MKVLNSNDWEMVWGSLILNICFHFKFSKLIFQKVIINHIIHFLTLKTLGRGEDLLSVNKKDTVLELKVESIQNQDINL